MSFWIDLAERAAATYVEAFLGLVIAAAATPIDIGTLQAAGIAAIPAGLAVIKAGLATFIGDPASASLAASVPTPATAVDDNGPRPDDPQPQDLQP